MADSFSFELVSPERLLISADAAEVQVPGSEGDFTVLPLHAPVLSTLRPGVIDVRLASGEDRHIFVRSGLADVSGSSLTILAQQAVDLDGIDRAWLAGEIRNAEEDVADAKDEDTRTAAANALERLKTVEANLPGAA